MDWPKLSLDWIKLKPRYLLGIAVTCLVVVGLPKPWREYLGYNEFVDPYKGWISLVGLVCGVYGVVMLIAGVKPLVVKKWKNWQFRIKAPAILRRLPPDEKAYVAKYIKKNVSSLTFMIGDGVINSLRKKNVVYQASNISVEDDEFAFNLRPWVVEALDKHPDLKVNILKCSDPESLNKQ
jgi:hypothetical protein